MNAPAKESGVPATGTPQIEAQDAPHSTTARREPWKPLSTLAPDPPPPDPTDGEEHPHNFARRPSDEPESVIERFHRRGFWGSFENPERFEVHDVPPDEIV